MVLDLVQRYRVRYFVLAILVRLESISEICDWKFYRFLLTAFCSQISRKGNVKKGSLLQGKPMTSQLYSIGQWTLVKTWKWRRKRRSLNRRISGSADTKCKITSIWLLGSFGSLASGWSLGEMLSGQPIKKFKCFRFS